MRKLCHRAQELDGLEVTHILQELVLTADELVERGRPCRRHLIVADLLLEAVAAAVGRELDLCEFGVVVTVLLDR